MIGHLDTVACKGQDEWDYPLHQAEVRGDILYGCGAVDMKGGDAAMILTQRQMIRGGKDGNHHGALHSGVRRAGLEWGEYFIEGWYRQTGAGTRACM